MDKSLEQADRERIEAHERYLAGLRKPENMPIYPVEIPGVGHRFLPRSTPTTMLTGMSYKQWLMGQLLAGAAHSMNVHEDDELVEFAEQIADLVIAKFQLNGSRPG